MILISTLTKGNCNPSASHRTIRLNNYNTLTFNKRIIYPSRHYPPASKEWKNSVYVYNKDYLKSLASKDEVVNSLIQNYFSLNIRNKRRSRRSRRVRILARRSSTKQFYISKAEVKQNNDKSIVTVYTFDRENQVRIRKLFFYK